MRICKDLRGMGASSLPCHAGGIREQGRFRIPAESVCPARLGNPVLTGEPELGSTPVGATWGLGLQSEGPVPCSHPVS